MRKSLSLLITLRCVFVFISQYMKLGVTLALVVPACSE
jgi:hypothetical protein